MTGLSTQLRTDEVQRLVLLAQQSDAYSFRRLVSHYEQSIYAAALLLTRDRYLAEEATQHAFISSWRNLKNLREPKKFPAWLYKITRRHAQRLLRLRNKEYRRQKTLDEHVLDIAQHKSNETELLEAVAHIPSKYREALILYYYQNQSVTQTADLLGISEAAVMKRLIRGREKLTKIARQTLSVVPPLYTKNVSNAVFNAITSPLTNKYTWHRWLALGKLFFLLGIGVVLPPVTRTIVSVNSSREDIVSVNSSREDNEVTKPWSVVAALQNFYAPVMPHHYANAKTLGNNVEEEAASLEKILNTVQSEIWVCNEGNLSGVLWVQTSFVLENSETFAEASDISLEPLSDYNAAINEHAAMCVKTALLSTQFPKASFSYAPISVRYPFTLRDSSNDLTITDNDVGTQRDDS